MSVPAAAGCVAWFTGLPASGKSTLARAVRDRLRRAGAACVLLDGDEVRAAISPAPGYDDAGRSGFYQTLAQLAALLARQDLVVLVAATAHRRAYREQARQLAPRFLEIYLMASLATCRARDPRGLYQAAAQGHFRTLPGAGAEYQPPLAAEVEVPEEEALGAAAARCAALLLGAGPVLHAAG